MSLQQLSNATVKLITSSQVITSVSSVVKELMENAIDAGATIINVKLEDNGLGKIEVKDDGCGIQKSDIKNVCLPSYTSKISDFVDLESLQSYGFRGEALSALCQVSDVVITTRTADDELATAYNMGNHGEVKDTKLSHHGIGTQITASHLFKNLPVRKQYLNSGRRAADELKRIESVVKALAVIHPSLRVTLYHNKCSLWQKTGVASLRLSLMQMVGHAISNKLEELSVDETEGCFKLIIPKKDCTDIVTQSSSESILVFINKRPVKYKKLEQMIMKHLNEYFEGQIPVRKYPYCLASINVSPSNLDVNLEPNKTRVLLKNEEEVLCVVEKLLSTYYAPKTESEPQNVIDSAVSPKKHKFVEENSETDQFRKKPKLTNCEKTDPGNDNSGVKFTNNKTSNRAMTSNEEFEAENGIADNVSQEGLCETEKSKENIKSWDNSFFDLESDLAPLCEDPKNRSYMNYVTHSKPSLETDGQESISVQEFNSNSLPSSNEREPCISDEMWAEIDRAAGWTDAQLSIINGETSKANSSKLCNGSTHTKSKTYAQEAASPVKTLSYQSKFWEKDNACPANTSFSSNEEDLVTKQNNRSYSKQSSLSCYISPKRERVWDEVDNSLLSLDLDCEETENRGCNLNETPITVTKEKWSTGNVRAANGKLVQGSCVLLPNAAAGSIPNQMDQSVSSQMGQKENSAFTKFSREIRPQILQEHPGIAFTKVASLMVSRWRSLKAEERERYENKARENDEERRRQYYNSTESTPLEPKEKKERIEKFQKLLNNSIEASPKINNAKAMKKRVARPGQKVHSIETSFEAIAKNLLESCTLEETAFGLIGQLKSGIWLYRQGLEIGFVRHWGLQETVVCDQLMKDHTIPLRRLDSEILLDEKLMGSDHWKLMLSLDKSYNGLSQHVTINSPFISKNGFRIEVNGGVEEVTCALTGVPSVSRFYGVAELKETLLLLEKYGPQATLDQCRPIKIRYYLEAEAVRTARESAALDRDSIDELLKYWHTTLNREGYVCLHNKPIFMPIHQLGADITEDLW